MLALRDHWVWDSWVADDGELYHLFFLKAPRALGDPGLRHAAARIGHAESTDLVDWVIRQDALGPAADGWDDLAVWTGSVARGEDGVWRLYYTGLSTRPGLGIRDQRIGLAESEDLTRWRRVGDRPLLCPDARWYDTLPEDRRHSDTWRDPFVYRDPGGDGWHMLITARAAGAPRLRDGVLGHARSEDMVTWELLAPVTEPAGFGQIEVSQVRVIDGQPVLVFTCHPAEQSPDQLARFGAWSTWYVLADSATGPWEIDRARPFQADARLFAAPLVQRRDGMWVFLGFRNREPEGILSFEIVDPIPVTLRDGVVVASGDDDLARQRPVGHR